MVEGGRPQLLAYFAASTRIMVTSGTSLITEVIDIMDETKICNNLGDFPALVRWTTGGLITSDARYFIVEIKCPCDFITVFWANFYFIFQMHHAKIFKMRYSKSLYQLFRKYES